MNILYYIFSSLLLVFLSFWDFYFFTTSSIFESFILLSLSLILVFFISVVISYGVAL